MTSISRLGAFQHAPVGGEEADDEAGLMAASFCREVAGVDDERDGRRSGRQWRSRD